MMNRKEVILLGIFVFTIFLMTFAKADIFMGTCEGYIKWLNGSTISGANVTVTVQGCTTPPENCVRSVLSQSNGYYVVANLNLPPYGNVSVSALKNSAYGTNTGQADAYQAAYVNVTMCEAPSSPSLIAVPDSHYPNITFWFNWTSGSSPYSTFDQWYWASLWQNASSPQSKTNLAFANYTWGARTCLSSQPSCCSPPAYDNFSVYNSPPCMPILTPQNDTTSNSVVLNWTSNTTSPCPDADGDPTYYNFRIDSNYTNNATPPQVVTGLSFGSHTWGAQECDPWECSNWALDTFDVYNTPCPPPTLTFQNNTCENQVILSWVSADNDSEGDACYDEFRLGGIIQSPASSPQIVSLTDIDLYNWGVRTCDSKGACSSWVDSSFIYCNCGIVEQIEGGRTIYRGGACILPAGYELVVTKPKEIYPGDRIELNVNLKYFTNITNLSIEVDSPIGIEISPLVYGPVAPNQEITFKLKGKISSDAEERKHTLFLKAFDGEKLLINKPIEIEVLSPPLTLVKLFRAEWPLSCCSLLFYVLLLILIAALAWLVRKTYLIYQEKKIKEGTHISRIKEEARKI